MMRYSRVGWRWHEVALAGERVGWLKVPDGQHMRKHQGTKRHVCVVLGKKSLSAPIRARGNRDGAVRGAGEW